MKQIVQMIKSITMNENIKIELLSDFLRFTREHFLLYDGDFYADSSQVRGYLTEAEVDYPISYDKIAKIYLLIYQ